MKVIDATQFDAGIYDQVENAADKVVLWLNPETKVWWAVVTTSAHDVEGVGAVVAAFALDKADAAVVRWAAQAATRAAHPENET